MGTAILGSAGAALGAAAGTAIGGPIFGAIIGQAIGGAAGAFVGSKIDQALFGPGDQRRSGVELRQAQSLSSAEGTPIPEIWGAMRLMGRPIWASQYTRRSSTTTQRQGGSGGGPKVTTENNTFSRSWALSLCRGPIDGIGRVWVNGVVTDIAEWNVRLHRGTADQAPDPLIVAIEGWAPARRGRAYLVIEDLDLTEWGNRSPAIEVEVFRTLAPARSAEALTRAVNIIPSAGEFVYEPAPVTDVSAAGAARALNRLGMRGDSDWAVSIDRLQQVAPNLSGASLTVAWFGDDLRAGACTLRPKVDNFDKVTQPYAWQAGGLTRATATRVSLIDDRPAYGGTPADRSVVAALRDLKARGLAPMLFPFILMDIAPGSGLPDPYGAPEQPAFPWRGRITSAADRTAGVAADIAAFFGAATAADFAIQPDDTISYSGPSDDWGYRRFILHHAMLAKAAGGVDTMLIGSEMRGLTWLRDATGAYPAVTALIALLQDVAAIGGVADYLGYGADWSEASAHQHPETPGALAFHLDPLIAHPSCAFFGISNYMPLTDEREGEDHLDAPLRWGIYDKAFIASRIRSGEGFDWFYASDADRAAQIRTPITDGAYGEPWVYRIKDLWSWWSNAHHNRPGGVRAATATAWVPQSKPIRFIELGVPALDKGANQPNVFFDPKSSESFFPYFSTGARDDAILRAALEAVLAFWEDPAQNPASGVYAGRMVDTARTHLWAWDARPWPEFPALEDVWSDGGNYRLGHWINGRLGKPTLAMIVAEVAAARGMTVDVERLIGMVDGVQRDGVMSDRDFLAPLLELYQADIFDRGDALWAGSRAFAPQIDIAESSLIAPARGEPPIETSDADDLDAPRRLRIQHYAAGSDYRQTLTHAPGWTGAGGDSVVDVGADVVMSTEEAQARAGALLSERRVTRVADRFSAPPTLLTLRPGVVARITGAAGLSSLGVIDCRALSVGWEWARPVEAERWDRAVYAVGGGMTDGRSARLPAPPPVAAPVLVTMDLPRLDAAYAEHAPYFAAYAKPWSGVAVWRGVGGALAPDILIDSPSVMGLLAAPLGPGTPDIWDDGASVELTLFEGGLASAPDLAVLNGANALAVEATGGGWEILQFAVATLIAPDRWRISRLLRGQRGTEAAMTHDAGARLVLLSSALRQPGYGPEFRTAKFDYRFGPATRPVDGASWSSFSAAFTGVGLRPFAPAGLTVSSSSGDLAASWKRRARWGGDPWDAGDVAAPDGRVYAVRWRAAGGALLRAETVTDVEAATFAAVDGAPATGSVEVAQVGPVWGEGPAATVAF